MNRRQRRAAGHRRLVEHQIHAALDPASPPSTPCPDCAAQPVGTILEHLSGCPISDGVDAATDDDRRYFEDHPGETTRVRPMTHAERLQLAHTDGQYNHPAWRTHGHIVVTNVVPGFRLRAAILLTQ
ncbi:hypothetical protein CRM90_28455 [Mycobacterium sp. ENV421]|uniref:hypothetical protein n=1 Tax=Mycobacterium sp. ENV421 TaxID=1213407 RepID=UPI000C998779|nr:hypothetical protein [Mycobacterium sp. ENV421]PND54347.1 hypothetical protein CRM90_28455 [Mycobacterium sp. ENV421]